MYFVTSILHHWKGLQFLDLFVGEPLSVANGMYFHVTYPDPCDYPLDCIDYGCLRYCDKATEPLMDKYNRQKAGEDVQLTEDDFKGATLSSSWAKLEVLCVGSDPESRQKTADLIRENFASTEGDVNVLADLLVAGDEQALIAAWKASGYVYNTEGKYRIDSYVRRHEDYQRRLKGFFDVVLARIRTQSRENTSD